jgi:hypothetical protein
VVLLIYMAEMGPAELWMSTAFIVLGIVGGADIVAVALRSGWGRGAGRGCCWTVGGV